MQRDIAEGNATKAKTDTYFQAACQRAEIPPTARQYSKWRRGFGKAFANRT